MGGHRLAGPDRAGFLSCVVANSEHEIEFRRAGFGELLQSLGAEIRGGKFIWFLRRSSV
jgi:hypothetical protein